MKKIEITNEAVLKIAETEYNEFTGGYSLQEAGTYCQIQWENGAREMLDNYNRVVEILSTLPEYSSGDEQ